MTLNNNLKPIPTLVKRKPSCVSKRSATSFRCNLPRFNSQMFIIMESFKLTLKNRIKRLFYQVCPYKIVPLMIKCNYYRQVSRCWSSSRTCLQKLTTPSKKLVHLSKSSKSRMIIWNLPISVKRIAYKWSWHNSAKLNLIRTPRTQN